MQYVNNIEDLDLNREYTYADYLTWRFKERVEIIKGKIMAMSPAPTRLHQQILGRLHFSIYQVFLNRQYEVYSAPFDVRLTNKKGKTSVVQPDLCVVCDKSKLDDKGCNGAPELIIEILSASNRRMDMQTKFELYEEAGVLEYWIVDPLSQCISINQRVDEKFVINRPHFSGEIAQSVLFPDLAIDVGTVFEE